MSTCPMDRSNLRTYSAGYADIAAQRKFGGVGTWRITKTRYPLSWRICNSIPITFILYHKNLEKSRYEKLVI